jgi:hypothetical protein
MLFSVKAKIPVHLAVRSEILLEIEKQQWKLEILVLIFMLA